MTIAQLLELSRQAHIRYRESSGRVKLGKVTHAPRLDACVDAITTAMALRTQADALDPEHSDGAWADDMLAMKATHAELMAFYAWYLANVGMKLGAMLEKAKRPKVQKPPKDVAEVGPDSHA